MEDEPATTNARPRTATIAGIGPGIPDDALGPGDGLPDPPSDAEVAAVARLLDAPVPGAPPTGEADDEAPGDVAPEGTPGTGENVCRACGGSGRQGEGACPACDGTGKVIEGVGGG